MNNSPMFDAFLKQQKYTDKEADQIEASIKQKTEDNVRKAKEILSRDQNISKYTSIPSNIKEGDLNQKTQSHHNFKNYDHSLEKVRHKFTKVNVDDGVEWGDGANDNGIIDRS
jgi:hypothetical protein